MKRLELGLRLGLLPLIALTWAPPATAESIESLTSAIAEQQDNQAKSAVATVGVAAELEGSAFGDPNSPGAIAQTSSANAITAVDIEETESGLSVNFTSDEPLTVETSEVVGNALVLTLPDATLALADPNQGEQFSPIDGIALVSVVGLAEGGVRVSITGNDAPPQVEVNTEGSNLVLGVTPGAASDVAAERDAIQIGVEGQTDSYYVPDSSTATRTDTPLDETPQSIQV
ncbi:MAG: AMIN domain-containing protein, partial [Cyanobacteria bacterium P01_F01_bin.153]